MNKFGYYLYNIIFWISRFITIFIFGTCIFSILNAKYVWSENFFPVIRSIILFYHSLENINYVDYSINILKNIVIYINYHLYFIIYLLIILILSKILFKIYKNYIINIIFFICFSILSYTLFITLNLQNSIQLSFILFILFTYIVLFILNLKLNKIPKIIILIPLISDLFLINHIISYIKKKKEQQIIYTNFSINIIIILGLSTSMNFYNLPVFCKYRILNEDCYSLDIEKNKLLFNEEKTKIFCYYDTESNKVINRNKLNMTKSLQLQSFALNKKLKECYIYDDGSGNIFVLDYENDFKIKQQISTPQYYYGDLDSYERILYDEFNNNIVILLENGLLYIINDFKKFNNFNDMILLNIAMRNDCIIYNPFRNSYLVSYWYREPYITEIFSSNYQINNIDVPIMQGYIALSKKNKEIYIAFHQQGRIGVYDAETMELKRKIKSNYTVKDITYDEDLNVLIAPSYFTGYVDIFLMDGTDKLLIRKFVGFELREAKFDEKKETLYVCSRGGLNRVPINIKELISKNKKVSHETKGQLEINN